MTKQETKMWQDDLKMIEMLRKENQELKKQLEENKDNYNCLLKQKEQFEYIMSKQVDYQGQRKEFIEYLEKEIVDCRAGSGQQYYYQQVLDMYKEIIGDKDEK